MKNILFVALTALAAAAHATTATESLDPKSGTVLTAGTSNFTAPDGQGQRIQAVNTAVSVVTSTVSAPAQVFYEVTWSHDGKRTISMTAVTDDGRPTPLSTTTSQNYRSCTSATACETNEVTTGLMISLTPRITTGGSILTSGDIDVSQLERLDTVPENGYVTQRPVVSTMSNHSKFSLKSGQTLVLPFDEKDGKYTLTIKAKIV